MSEIQAHPILNCGNTGTDKPLGASVRMDVDCDQPVAALQCDTKDVNMCQNECALGGYAVTLPVHVLLKMV